MEFDWEPFTDVGTSFAARITIRQTGQLGFTSGAINRYRIGDFSHAALYFDQGRKAVGIELTNENKTGAIPIKQKPSNTYITGKNFLDRYGISYSKARRFDLNMDEKSGLLYFLLDGGQDENEGEDQSDSDD